MPYSSKDIVSTLSDHNIGMICIIIALDTISLINNISDQKANMTLKAMAWHV